MRHQNDIYSSYGLHRDGALSGAGDGHIPSHSLDSDLQFAGGEQHMGLDQSYSFLPMLSARPYLIAPPRLRGPARPLLYHSPCRSPTNKILICTAEWSRKNFTERNPHQLNIQNSGRMHRTRDALPVVCSYLASHPCCALWLVPCPCPRACLLP